MNKIEFPKYSGIRCLMMPYIQGDFTSVPEEYSPYREAIESLFLKQGDIGYLTIDESPVQKGDPHRGARAKYGRALHTEAGRIGNSYYWGGGGQWGGRANVELDRDVRILLANNLDGSCAVWDVEQESTTEDGDIGHLARLYPYESANLMRAGQVEEIGIFTPHESLPVKQDFKRQFLRIISSGVHGREPYFTKNPKIEAD